jgi:hypothetical protein
MPNKMRFQSSLMRRRFVYAFPWVETHGYIQASLCDERQSGGIAARTLRNFIGKVELFRK